MFFYSNVHAVPCPRATQCFLTPESLLLTIAYPLSINNGGNSTLQTSCKENESQESALRWGVTTKCNKGRIWSTSWSEKKKMNVYVNLDAAIGSLANQKADARFQRRRTPSIGFHLSTRVLLRFVSGITLSAGSDRELWHLFQLKLLLHPLIYASWRSYAGIFRLYYAFGMCG